MKATIRTTRTIAKKPEPVQAFASRQAAGVGRIARAT